MNTLDLMSIPGLSETNGIDKMLCKSRKRLKEAQERRMLSIAFLNAKAGLDEKKDKKQNR